MPALGFGTLIPDATETRNATRTAIETGFRHFDCSERYRNEEQVGQAIREAIQASLISRNDLFITTKLWVNKTPAQVLLAWAIQRGTAVLTTPKTPDRTRENFDVSALPGDAMEQINAIQARQRLNLVVGTGVPGFIAKGN